MGQDCEPSQYGVYFFYPFVMLSRMAQIVSSIIWFSLTGNSVLHMDWILSTISESFLPQVYLWCLYIIGMLAFPLILWIFSWLTPWCILPSLFRMDFVNTSSRGARRKAIHCTKGNVAFAYNETLLVLSCYMLYCHVARLFSSHLRWFCSFVKHYDSAVSHLAVPITYLDRWFPPWPPDGLLCSLLLLLCIFSTHAAVVLEVFRRYFAIIVVDLPYTLAVSQLILDSMKKRLSSFLLPQFFLFFTSVKTIKPALAPCVLATVLASCEEDISLDKKACLGFRLGPSGIGQCCY